MTPYSRRQHSLYGTVLHRTQNKRRMRARTDTMCWKAVYKQQLNFSEEDGLYQLYKSIYAILQLERYILWRLFDVRNSKVLNVGTFTLQFYHCRRECCARPEQQSAL